MFALRYTRIHILSIIVAGLSWTSCNFDDINFEPPAPVAKEATDITSNSFTASWNPVVGAQEYVLQISATSTFSSESSGEVSQTIVKGTSYQAEGLEASQPYYYRVRAVVDDQRRENVYSNIIALQTLALPIPVARDASGIKPLRFTAHWQSVSGVEGYLLYVATDANFSKPLEDYDGIAVADTALMVEGLTLNQKYFYRVRSQRGTAQSDYSNIIDLITTELDQPQTLEATEVTFVSFIINWKPVEDASAYWVFVSTDPTVMTDFLPNMPKEESAKSTSATIVGLRAGTTYYYRVQALNEKAPSEKSLIASVVTQALPPPVAQPATATQVDAFQANWNSVESATSYFIDVARDAGFVNYVSGFKAKEVIDTFVVVPNLLNTTYYYRIRARGFESVSNNSNTITVETASFTGPEALSALEVGTNSFKAIWKKVDNIDNYHLDVATDINFNNILPNYNGTVVSDTFRVVSGLTNNTSYYYRVRAVKGNVFSGYSDIINQTTTDLSKPITIEAGSVTVSSFNARWNPVAGATGYLLDVSSDPFFSTTFSDYTSRAVNDVSQLVEGLEASTVYYYRVRAKNDVSISENSDVRSVKTNTIPLPPPTVNAAKDQKTFSFTAQWESVENAYTYQLFVATDAAFTEPLPEYDGVEVASTSLPVSGLDPFTTYYYRLRSKRGTTLSDFSVNTTIVDPAIAASCRISDRMFDNWRKESYTYNSDGLVNTITLTDINNNDVIRRTNIDYVGDQIKQATVRIRNEIGLLEDREVWTYVYSDGRIEKIEIDTLETGPPTDLSMVFGYADGKIEEVEFYNSSSTLIKTEKYSYNAQGEVKEIKEAGTTTKQFVYGNEFNTNSLLPQDVALLLFDPTGGASHAFIPTKIPTYYQYLDEFNAQQSFSFAYQFNKKRIPVKILRANGIPEMTYVFYGNCISNTIE